LLTQLLRAPSASLVEGAFCWHLGNPSFFPVQPRFCRAPSCLLEQMPAQSALVESFTIVPVERARSKREVIIIMEIMTNSLRLSQIMRELGVIQPKYQPQNTEKLTMKLMNKLNNRLARKQSKGGFSLVELLVVIAVIGILAAIAIPALTNVFESSETAKSKRNAQNIASTYTAARAAGAAVTTTSIATIIDDLETGVQGRGAFVNTTFKLSPLGATERGLADDYLVLSGSTLTYDQAGGH
jgi:prepilin-type N-terminal cleavage/methylation domain-containing protein